LNLARASQKIRNAPGGAVLAWCSDSRFAFVIAAEALTFVAEAVHEEFFCQPDPVLFVPNRASVTVMENPGIEPAFVRFREQGTHLRPDFHLSGSRR
jgi:hypothetical protein